MYKFMLALFFAFFSLSSLPAKAANCSGGTILFDTDPGSDHGYWMNGYTSADNESLLIMKVTVQDGMSCDPDYVENAVQMGKMVMRMTGGGSCKNGNTITTPYPGIEWQLEGMHCDTSSIISDNVKSAPWNGRINWPAGTVLGKAKLVVEDQYWIQSTQSGRYTVSIQMPSVGNTLSNSPAVNVRSGLGATIPFIFNDNATCGMSLSPENIDFGKLTPSDLTRRLYKEILVSYSCRNGALINGLYVRFDPENVVDAANGLFSASDANGRKLNFQITRLYGSEQNIPLNTNYRVYQPTRDDLDASARFRIYVKPSTPFPAGKVSTYLNISLIYR